jgi:hypothetical protein
VRFIRLIVRRVVRGLGHLDFSILSLNGDSKVPIFLFLSVPFSKKKKEEECRKQKIRVQKLNTQEQKKQPHDKKRRQRKTQI